MTDCKQDVFPGRVSEILDKMHRMDSLKPVSKTWTPPVDYKLIAANMSDSTEYVKRCEEWIAAHPPKVRPPPSAPIVIDTEPIIKLFAKYNGSVPSIPELEKAWWEAGYSEEKIAKAKAHREKMESTIEERVS